MKKTGIFTKIFALILALVMVVTPLLGSFASAYEVTCPKINIQGFMSAKIYAVKDDSGSEQLWPPTSDKILTLVKNIIGPLTKLSFNHDWDAFANALADEINLMLGDLWLDENGEPANGSGACMIYPPQEEVTRNGEYDFVFDWRIDPFEAAKQFKAFIDYIKEASGSDKVVIEAHSYAGIVTMCYFQQYGTQDVKSVCFNSTAVYGAGFTSEIIKGNLFLGGDSDLTGTGAESLIEYLLGTFSNNQYAEIIGTVIKMLRDAGLIGFISDSVNKLFTESSDILYRESIIPLFGLWPAIWSMVPDDDFESGYEYIFNDVLLQTDKDYSGIIGKIDRFNSDVRPCREDILNGVNDEINLYVISRYGYSSIPLSTSWSTMSDGVLDTASTSFGAKCSSYNDFEIFDISDEYVSPNGQVDTSTCLFPEQTWMLRGIGHVQHYSDVSKMVNTLLYSEEQATVSTYGLYPRFMFYSAVGDVLVPDTGIRTTLTFLDRLKLFFSQLFSLVISIFKK